MGGRVDAGMALYRCRSLFPRFVACRRHGVVKAAIYSRQMSTESKNVAQRLKSAGLIRSQGFIGGNWVDAYDGKSLEVVNPATGEVITNVSCMGSKETNDAIAAAQDAFPAWSKLTAAERSKCLRKWYDLIVSRKEELGQLMTLEQGKPLKEAIGEVNYGASFVEFYAEEAKRVYGDIIPATSSDRRLFVLKQVKPFPTLIE